MPPLRADAHRGLDNWRGKILNLGSNLTLRNVHIGLSRMPAALSQRAAALIPAIIVLPHNDLDIHGASFYLTNAVLVFEDDEGWEEQLCVLHEIAHILDPGWQAEALKQAVKQDMAHCPAFTRRTLGRVGNSPSEQFAELSAWEMAEVPNLSHLPRAREVVHEALYWESR